jgi:hypothetical protein
MVEFDGKLGKILLKNYSIEKVDAYSEHDIKFMFKDGNKLNWNM